MHPFGKVRHNISLSVNTFPSNQSEQSKEMFSQSEAKVTTTRPADRLVGRQRQPVCAAWSSWAHVSSLSMELNMQASCGFAFGSTPLTLRRKLVNYQLPWPGQGGAGFASVELEYISCSYNGQLLNSWILLPVLVVEWGGPASPRSGGHNSRPCSVQNRSNKT